MFRFTLLKIYYSVSSYFIFDLRVIFKNVPDLLDYILEGYEENWQYVIYDQCDFYCLKMLDCLERTNFITSYMRIYCDVEDDALIDNSFNLPKVLKYKILDKGDYYTRSDADYYPKKPSGLYVPYYEAMRHEPVISVMIFLKYNIKNDVVYGAMFGFYVTWDNPILKPWAREGLMLGFFCDDGKYYRHTSCIYITPTRVKLWCSTYIFVTEEEILANNSLHGRLYCMVW